MFDAVPKPRSAAELARLIDVELLPECDPRLFDCVPDTSVYYRIKESLKTTIAVAAQTSQELQDDSQKTVGRRKDHSTASGDSVRQSRAESAKPRHHQKELVRPLPQRTPSLKPDTSSLKQSVSGSRRQRTSVGDADRSLHTAESVNENLSLAPTLPRKKPRTDTSNKERTSERHVTKAHTSRKRKRKDFEELMGHKDSFPSMDCLMYDEMALSWHLPQLSFFAELDHNPDDPLLLISLCELDDITAFQRQDFIHDLNSTYIGRKPRFTAVRSPYCDRSSRRLGQLSLQTYCDGHFIDCGLVSHVHMAGLHHWATREPLKMIVCSILKDEHKPAVSLPYPSVRCLSDVLCYWLSSELCYLMSGSSIDCTDPPDIFIGSSLQSELTANCLYQMFCRYVEFLCEKAEKYFTDVERVGYGKLAARAGQQTGREVEPETSAAHGGKRAKLLKRTLPSLRRKAPDKRTPKQLSSWLENVDYDYEDMSSEQEKYVLLDDADLEQLMPFDEKGRHSGDRAENDAESRHRKADEPAAHRKRKLLEDYYGDRERWTGEMQSKARRAHRDHTRLLAREKENDVDVYGKNGDRERARRKDAADSSSTKQDELSPSKREDEDGSIVVKCSDTGRTVIETKSREVTTVDELKSVDEMPASLMVHDELSEPNSLPLYSVVHDHCYSSASLCSVSVQSSATAVADLGKEEHPIDVDVDGSENINPPVLSTHAVLPELTDAGENVGAEVPSKHLDGKKSHSPLPQMSSVELQEKTEKAVGLVKELNSASDNNVPHSQADVSDKSGIRKPLSRKTQGVQLDVLSLKQTGKSTARKLHPLSSLSMVKMASVPEPEVNAKGLIESPKQPVMKKPVDHKEFSTPPQKVRKEDVTKLQKSHDSGENAKRKSDNEEISLKEDLVSVSISKENVIVSNKDINSNKNKALSTPPKTSDVSNDDSKISAKKIHIAAENADKMSNKVDTVAVKIMEPEKVSADTGLTSEPCNVPVGNDSKVADAEVSVESEKTAAEAVPSAAELAATARAASHYEDAYLSDMADAYDVWPLSNFDPTFDPTDVPEGHVYNPFRKTWPILQHVIDGKADLLLKVCSFPDVSLFSIRRVMRENGFLWAVCLSLFEPALSKPDSTDSLLDSVAGNKVKGAKSSNPLMQAFRQAVEAKKKVAVAAKSKLSVLRQNSDDVGGTQPWSTRRPAGKMSIVFGSAVKSGGSLSSVVRTDQPAKTAPSANKFSNLLTSVMSKMNSDMSDVISWKCGEGSLDKDAHTAEYKSNLLATSKHLSTLSDLAVDVYDRAEYKLEKIFSAEDAEKQKNVETSAEDSKSAAVLEMPAAVITKVATATCQAQVLVSTPASDIITSSSTSLSSDDTSKTSTVQITHVSVSVSAGVRSVSAASDVSQPSVSQPTAAKSALASAADVTAAGDSVCVTTAADAVTTECIAVSAVAPVTVKVAATTVADMLPPPLPPLSLSCIGVGFDSHLSAVATSTASEALTSWPSTSSASKPVDQVSMNPPTCTTAYQATVGAFALPPTVSSQPLPSAPSAFSNTPLPVDQLIRVPPPPAIHPNLYSVPPPVGIPLNVPPPGFVSTSIPPPPLPCPPPPMPWCPPSSSAAGEFPAAAGTKTSVPVSGFQNMSVVPSTAVSCVGIAASSPTPSGKAVAGSSMLQNLQTSGVLVTPSSMVCSASVTSKTEPKSVMSSLIHGGRFRGPLKLVTPVTPSTPPGLAGSAVRQVRPFPSTASAEITQVSPLQVSNNQLRVTVPGARSSAPAAGFPVRSQSNRVPMQPVTAGQNVPTNTSSPHGVFQPRLPQGRFAQPTIPRLPQGQLAQPTVLGSQPPGAIRPVSAQPIQQNDQPGATGAVVGQSPRGVVRPRLPVNLSAQPRGALPENQPRGPLAPALARAAGPVMGQSPGSTIRPQATGPGMPVPLSSSGRGPTIRTESRLPNSPSQPSGAGMPQPSRPIAAAGGTGAVQPGRGLLTPNSRVYVLNSDSSPVCKDVEVSMQYANLVYCQSASLFRILTC